MMTLRYLSIAETELEEALVNYEEQELGLGLLFLQEVRKSITRIALNPEAWVLLSGSTRRCRTKKFPYGIIYQIRPDEIVVVAIAHLRREPDYWAGRI